MTKYFTYKKQNYNLEYFELPLKKLNVFDYRNKIIRTQKSKRNVIKRDKILPIKKKKKIIVP